MTSLRCPSWPQPSGSASRGASSTNCAETDLSDLSDVELQARVDDLFATLPDQVLRRADHRPWQHYCALWGELHARGWQRVPERTETVGVWTLVWHHDPTLDRRHTLMNPNDLRRSDVLAALADTVSLNQILLEPGQHLDLDAAADAILAGHVTPDDNDGTITDPAAAAYAFGAFISDGPWWA